MHIAIEGLDGVGKTTIAKILAEKIEFEYVEKPLHFFTDIGDVYTNYNDITSRINGCNDNTFIAMFYLAGNYYTSRLSKYNNIVTDRHIASTYYWNCDDGNKRYFDIAVDMCGKPDYSILLFADKENRISRITSRDINDPDIEKVEYGEIQFKKLKKYMESYSMPYTIVDTSGKTIDEVVDEILNDLVIKKIIDKVKGALYEDKNKQSNIW